MTNIVAIAVVCTLIGYVGGMVTGWIEGHLVFTSGGVAELRRQIAHVKRLRIELQRSTPFGPNLCTKHGGPVCVVCEAAE